LAGDARLIQLSMTLISTGSTSSALFDRTLGIGTDLQNRLKALHQLRVLVELFNTKTALPETGCRRHVQPSVFGFKLIEFSAR